MTQPFGAALQVPGLVMVTTGVRPTPPPAGAVMVTMLLDAVAVYPPPVIFEAMELARLGRLLPVALPEARSSVPPTLMLVTVVLAGPLNAVKVYVPGPVAFVTAGFVPSSGMLPTAGRMVTTLPDLVAL